MCSLTQTWMEELGGVLIVRLETSGWGGAFDAHRNLFQTLQLGRRLKRLVFEIGVGKRKLPWLSRGALNLQEGRALVKARLRCTPFAAWGLSQGRLELT